MEKRVAIIGSSFRFPQAPQHSFWAKIVDNEDLVSHVENGRWSFDAYTHPSAKHPGTSYTFAAGSIGDVSGFDAGFFGISPREASLMDPQQRILLEMTWEAIENAGKAPTDLKGSQCGVYIGIASADYANRFAEDLYIIDSSVATGNTSSIAANRISYLFDLHGPSIAMDTACSSSMVAFHQACQAIRSGEIEEAITGGVSLHLHPYGFIAFSKATMLSKKGRCQVFDEAGDGYVRSEGGGIFLLKDFDAAIRDGDNILAVVAASSVNTDGYKSGLTVPNPQAQASLMESTYAKAGLTADDIDYIEAHGTGTAVGDPIETNAIGIALGQKRSSPLPIGSVKSNMGHLEAASGIAGLAKALYSLRYRQVPATIGVKNLNPNIKFDEWNLLPVTENISLDTKKTLTIGINSFGFGGANAHVILQTPPTIIQNIEYPLGNNVLPIVISAKESSALEQSAQQAINLFAQDHAFYDLAYNYSVKRERHLLAHVIWANNKDDAVKELTKSLDEGISPIYCDTPSSPLAFVYSGNGCQWELMGKSLLEASTTFKNTLEDIDRIFVPLSGFSITDELLGLNGSDRFVQTEIAQPALFAIQVGMTEVLREHHIDAQAVTGHSVGEVAAAWASGALSLKDAVHVIFYRSQSQGLTAGLGEMTAVAMSAEDAEQRIKELALRHVELAGINSYKGITLAGNPDQLSIFEQSLDAEKIFKKRLDLNYAFHSSVMDSVEDKVKDSLAHISPSASSIPFYSTVSGSLYDGQKLDAGYWWDNIRQPVQFQPAIEQLIDDGFTTFIEIGAHPVLKSYLNDALKNKGVDGAILSTMRKSYDRLESLMPTISQLLLLNAESMHRFFPHIGAYVELPCYPWQRQKLWHSTTSESIGLLTREKQHELLGFPVKQMENTWDNTLDTTAEPWLADHVVGDNTIFPGTGFSELLIAATQLCTASETIELEEIEIKSPLLLDDQTSKKIRTTVQMDTGKIEISSREFVTGDKWTVNATGRFLKQPTDRHLQGSSPDLPSRLADFVLADHLQMTALAGLTYGPAFQTITHGWHDNDSVLGVFAADIPYQGYTLHPGSLDCTFQMIIQFLKEMLQTQQGVAYVPTRIGRLYVRSGEHKLHLAQAKLLKRSPHSMTADFDLFDSEGQQVASIKEARFRAVKVKKSTTQQVDYLDYYLTSVPREISNEFSFSHVIKEITHHRSTDSINTANRYAQEVEPLFDALSTEIIREALTQLKQLQLLSKSAIEEIIANNPASQSLWHYVLRTGLTLDLLTETETGWQINDVDECTPSQTIWQIMARDYPDYFAITHLLGRFGLHLSDALTGKTSIESLGLDNSLYPILLEYRKNSHIAHDLSVSILQQVKALISGKNKERVRLIEVGIHTSEFAKYICPELDFTRCDFSFASINEACFAEAESLQEDFPLVNRYNLLDYDVDNCLQHQLALVNLDGICVKDIGVLIRHLEPLLASEANIIIIAPTPSEWVDALLSCNEDWWLDSGSQQLSAEQWLSLFKDNGLTNVEPEFSLSLGNINLFTARAPSKATTLYTKSDKCALILTDEENSSLASLLAKQNLFDTIEKQILSLKELCSLSTEEIQTLVHRQAITDLILLNGLSSKSSLDQLSLRCKALNHLYKAIELQTQSITLWIITQGVANTYLADTYYTCTNTGNTSDDSAVWGFARTLMNESQKCTLRLIDIPTNRSDISLNILFDELNAPSDELELLIDNEGTRFAPRLRINAAPNTASEGSHSGEEFYLGFSMPGQLKNLSWLQKHSSSLKENDIRVTVKATGLNFRDVMYTLGLLSDEAIENGFAGPSLGLEFAGVVSEIGSAVTDFQLGDHVVGFGPASFSNSVITQSSAISHIPSGINFAAASTIPSTFLTVYYALHHLARLEPGEKVLIHGAAGGVGIAAIQIAQWIGAEIYATAGSPSKRDFLKMMGVQHIYDSRALTFAEEILDATRNKGVDVVLNSLAGEAINQNLRVLKPFGRFLELGKRDFYENTPMGLRPFRNNISYFGIDADQLMQEKPALTDRLFKEMIQLFNDGVLTALPYTRFDANQIVEAFRYMQQAKQIGKIVITYEQGVQAQTHAVANTTQTLSLHPNASYLITGGLGGFGLKTAQWLTTRGAKNLILISRRGASSEEAQAFLAECQTQGIKTLCPPCDVSDKEALASVLENAKQTMPPLKGVIHAAAVIEDSLAMNLTDEQIDRVLLPKVAGAKWLDELTDDLTLDFFVLYSSATTLLGNPGQACYVAANHWLETLAAARIQRGKPATCPRWGAIDDVGFLARNTKVKEALQSRIGGQALPSDLALQALEQLILNKITNQGVLDFEWGPLKRFLPSAAQPKFREIDLTSQETAQGDDNRVNIEELLAKTDKELHAALQEILKNELGEILMISPDKLDINRSMYDMGLDSLMGVELMSAIESRLGVSISVMALSDTPTISKLSEKLASQLRGESNDDNMLEHVAKQHLEDSERD